MTFFTYTITSLPCSLSDVKRWVPGLYGLTLPWLLFFLFFRLYLLYVPAASR